MGGVPTPEELETAIRRWIDSQPVSLEPTLEPGVMAPGLGISKPPWTRRPVPHPYLRRVQTSFFDAVGQCLGSLDARWAPSELAETALQMHFVDRRWLLKYYDEREPIQQSGISDLGRTLLYILQEALVRHPPPNLASALRARVRTLLDANAPGDVPGPAGRHGELSVFLRPYLDDCMGLLCALRPDDQLLELAQELVVGGFDTTIEVPGGKLPPQQSYGLHSSTFGDWLPILLEWLAQSRRLDYTTFVRCMEHSPGLWHKIRFWVAGVDSAHWGKPSSLLLDLVQTHSSRLLRDRFSTVDLHTAVAITQIHGLRGSEFLALAAENHARLGLGPLSSDLFSESPLVRAVIHLACSRDTEPHTPEEMDRVLRTLRAVPRRTLECLLPIAAHSRRLLCRALSWESCVPLIDLMEELSRLGSGPGLTKGNIPNSPDTAIGTVDIGRARSALELAGNAPAQHVLGLFQRASNDLTNSALLLEAVGGWNRPTVEEHATKRNQVAVKALGLLPLARGRDEAIERYLFFKKFASEARQFGPMRQANEQAAAQVGLTNLARTMGYPDGDRLEWSIEAEISKDAPAEGVTITVSPYEVELKLREDGVETIVRRGGKTLASVPPVVRKDGSYQVMKEGLTRVKGQASRFRRTFERYLETEETLALADMEALFRIPLARRQLENLVLQSDDGEVGICDGGNRLARLDGTTLTVDGPVTILHPLVLQNARTLGAWRREIVRRRHVQPFKQVFREIYLLTPAEAQGPPETPRFAGQLLDSRVASKLLQSRGWQVESGDAAVTYKLFPKAGLQAVFDFPQAGHYLGETRDITSGTIYFGRIATAEQEAMGRWIEEERRIPLTDVPDIVFSEVMRDADLVVSVAQRRPFDIPSQEVLRGRRDILEALLEDLGLSHLVTFEGHFAHVQGKLARYRVHLGSATIHIDPGGAICPVPEGWGNSQEKRFVPVSPVETDTAKDVATRVLMLLFDDQITDKGIRKQIEAQRAG